MTIDLMTLADRIAIEERLYLYGHLLDTKRFEQVAAEIFTEDADIHLGGENLIGRAAIAGRLEDYRHTMLGSSHVITNIIMTVNGDDASTYSKVGAWHWFAGSSDDTLAPADMVSIGGYEDRLRRTDDGWRIYHRRGYSSGTGVGVGAVPEPLREMLESLAGRMPNWTH
jgi:hypothetical protein